MPQKWEHVKSTERLYGVSAEDIHSWMDEPWILYGEKHRKERHNLDFVPKIFVGKYGEKLTRQIMLDHILLDTNENYLSKLRSEYDESSIAKLHSQNSINRNYRYSNQSNRSSPINKKVLIGAVVILVIFYSGMFYFANLNSPSITQNVDSSVQQTYPVYIGSKNSNIYHKFSCEWAQKISLQNSVYFYSKADAESKGYKACLVCKP